MPIKSSALLIVPQRLVQITFFLLQITFLILPTNTHLPAKPDYPLISAEPWQCLDSTVAPFSAFGVSSHRDRILTPHLSPISNASFHKLPLIHLLEVISPFTELCTSLYSTCLIITVDSRHYGSYVLQSPTSTELVNTKQLLLGKYKVRFP